MKKVKLILLILIALGIYACTALKTLPVQKIVKEPKITAEEHWDYITMMDIPGTTIIPCPVDDPKGVVILMSQTHRMPKTRSLDPINDAAVSFQNLLYEKMKMIITNHIITDPLIGVEGAEGEIGMDNPIIQFFSEKKSEINDLKQIQQRMLGYSANDRTGKLLQLSNIMEQGVDFAESSISRVETLTNASLRLKAEMGNKITLIGVEERMENDEAYNILTRWDDAKSRFYYLAVREACRKNPDEYPPQLLDHLSDRLWTRLPYLMSKVQMYQRKPMALRNRISLVVMSYNSLQRHVNDSPVNVSLDVNIGATHFSQKYDDIVDKLWPDDVYEDELERPNIYNDVDDIQQIVEIIKDLKTQFNNKAMTDREWVGIEKLTSKMTSGNFPVGILVYGANHEDGFIEKLNSKGYSVLSVKITG